MTREAPAKLNLGLHVLRKREDGYHDLDTVFLAIDWFDRLTVDSEENLKLRCSDPSLPVGPGNLCYKAATMLAESAGIEPQASIRLQKSIPTSAGLGGGSSDAATTLRLLNELWELDWSIPRLLEIGAKLGSDVPFFLGPSPARGTGRGEILESMPEIELPFSFVVVKPDTKVSTADAYSWITPEDNRRVNLADVVASADLDRWRKELINDFELPVAARRPVIGQVRSRLIELGAGYVAMTGSGSAVYGVFESDNAGRDAVQQLSESGWTTRLCRPWKITSRSDL